MSISAVVPFFIGAFAMRGAGCTWNDIVDRDLDARVERTRSRPIRRSSPVFGAAGFLSRSGIDRARGPAAVQSVTVGVRLASLAVVAVYPSEADHVLAADRARPRVLVGCVDGMAGHVRAARSARLPALRRRDFLGDRHVPSMPPGPRGRCADWHQVDRAAVPRAHQAHLALFYALAILFIALAGWSAGAGIVFLLGLLAFAAHLAWQIRRLDIDDPVNCLKVFKSNRDAGLILFAGFGLDAAARHAL
jgi:4-hydroxybenzoate polyprenyltransferase